MVNLSELRYLRCSPSLERHTRHARPMATDIRDIGSVFLPPYSESVSSS